MRLLRDAETQALTALATRRHQVQTMVVAERNRLGTATSAVRPHIEAHIAWLTQQLADLDRQLRQTLRQSPVWRAQDDLLCSVPGVGAQLSLTLLAGLHAQFRQFHPQRACQHPAPGPRAQQVVLRPPERAGLDQVAVHAGQLPLPPAHVGLDAPLHPAAGRPRQLVPRGGQLLDGLAPARDDPGFPPVLVAPGANGLARPGSYWCLPPPNIQGAGG